VNAESRKGQGTEGIGDQAAVVYGEDEAGRPAN
jgi:hypothetical protein